MFETTEIILLKLIYRKELKQSQFVYKPMSAPVLFGLLLSSGRALTVTVDMIIIV